MHRLSPKQRRYHARVQAWCKQYNVRPPRPSYDLTKIKSVCLKCNSTYRVQRHHKGHEYLFACILPERYAARYVSFYEKDTSPLCKRCHQNFHRVIKPLIETFLDKIRGGRVSFSVCERYRKLIIMRFEKWLTRKVPAPALV